MEPGQPLVIQAIIYRINFHTSVVGLFVLQHVVGLAVLTLQLQVWQLLSVEFLAVHFRRLQANTLVVLYQQQIPPLDAFVADALIVLLAVLVLSPQTLVVGEIVADVALLALLLEVVVLVVLAVGDLLGAAEVVDQDMIVFALKAVELVGSSAAVE